MLLFCILKILVVPCGALWNKPADNTLLPSARWKCAADSVKTLICFVTRLDATGESCVFVFIGFLFHFENLHVRLGKNLHLQFTSNDMQYYCFILKQFFIEFIRTGQINLIGIKFNQLGHLTPTLPVIFRTFCLLLSILLWI